ncbi:carboxypeptidase regulatory-like domain-containing protein [Nostoc sp. FACHB-190]|uniref:carboxypeptidase-like regulatory domain-containing protein n=1 Tax=Nostoc sp. FACHB-190 TaxID=2692838 RepID=UPI00168A3999|nr:carboxypeptidase regulatory-like domain-containing protein [Nostoc sp. FACHB-190]MBD2299223.1 carboxypeptidase regulatory-like domain-containing protein [Nostoc sp. FACHB-190]
MSYLISNTELSPDTNYLPSVNAIAQPQTAASLSSASSTPVVIKPSAPENLPPQYSPIDKTLTPTATIKSSASQTRESEIQQFAPVVAPPESFAPEASLSHTVKLSDDSEIPFAPVVAPPESFTPEASLSHRVQLSDSSLQTSPEEKTKARSEPPSIKVPISEELQVFPVGLDVDQRPSIKSVLMRGREDGMQAINFEQWLIPYEAVVRALQLNVTTLADGQLEIRAPGLVTRINPQKLTNDPQLGLVFSVAQLQTLLGVTAKFDISDYAVRLERPWLLKATQVIAPPEAIVELAGLPEVPAPGLTLTAVEQKLNVSGSASGASNYQGDFAAVGTALGGSWFVRVNQPQFQNPTAWQVAEAQFLRQTNQADYVIGSQAPFWLSQGTGDYWGLTTIQRWGFQPPKTVGGGLSPNQRMQSDQIGRVITGKAAPGTLVRLTQGLGDRIIAEVLVDSSEIYRFNDVKVDTRFLGATYQLLLYPQGRLTETPEIRNVTFSTLPGQLPAGASALVVSGGFRRQFAEANSVIGEFADFRGGVAQRWGLSPDLTVGLGGVYDQSFRGLAEIFYQPQNLPLKVALSALSGDRWDINTNVTFDISPQINTRFTSDRYKSRFDFDWRMSPWLTLLGGVDSKEGGFGGVQIAHNRKNSFTFARMTFNTQSHLRWNLLHRRGQLELNSNGNEIASASELAYYLSPKKFTHQGNALFLGYETSNIFTQSDRLATLGWRYRSPQRSLNGNYFWEAQLAYGIGSLGSGVIATLGTNILPGLLLRGRYQGISTTSNEPSFGLELVSSLDLQRGIKPHPSRQANNLRTQGGIWIQPFFDRNGNGKRDPNEPIYLDQPNLLFTINNQPLQSFAPTIQNDGALIYLSPGKYRLDLDPAGFPANWQTAIEALAVDVVAGSYTPVMLPMIRSFTRSGVVTDSRGKPIPGAKVEAIELNSGQKRFSVTNGAGVYYLQGLQQGNYKIEVNGQPLNTENLQLQETSAPFQELNLQ